MVVDDVERARAQLDELLFSPTGWFAIDEGNRRVPGVYPSGLDQALALVGQGRVASVVGRLRPEVVGVDVDAAGEVGRMAAETLRDWCAARGLWHLVRESGGAYGRAHVLVVPGLHRDDFLELVVRLRLELRLGSTKLDVRDAFRPLSAPHRRTGPTPAPQGVAEAATSLLAALGAPKPSRRPLARPARRRKATDRPAAGGGARGAVSPLPAPVRSRRPLPPVWAAYLAQGRAAAADVDTQPDERSQIELDATRALVLAGYSEPEAWAAIEAAHPTAFTKARERGRVWWWIVWDKVVRTHVAWREAQAPQQGTVAGAGVVEELTADDERALARVAAAQERLALVWRSWPRATRHTDLEVARVVLARMARHRTDRLQVAQRDLVLECAVRSRAAVVAALGRLSGRGLVEVWSTYQAGTTDTSNTLVLPDVVDGVAAGGVLRFSPHSFSPPLAQPTPLPTRRGLPSLPHVTTAEALAGAEGGLVWGEVAEVAGLLPDGYEVGQVLSVGQRRQILGYLRTLADLGLAHTDGDGCWHATAELTALVTGEDGSTEVAQAGTLAHEAVAAQVTAERREFRDRVDPARRRAAWEAQRAAAIARSRKAQRARQVQWWAELPVSERQERTAVRRAAFAALPPVVQHATKTRWATANAAAGVVERARYEDWVASLSHTERVRRAGERAAAFAARPVAERVELAVGWARHRTSWGLPAPRLPRLDDMPEADLLVPHTPVAAELALFDTEPDDAREALQAV